MLQPRAGGDPDDVFMGSVTRLAQCEDWSYADPNAYNEDNHLYWRGFALHGMYTDQWAGVGLFNWVPDAGLGEPAHYITRAVRSGDKLACCSSDYEGRKAHWLFIDAASKFEEIGKVYFRGGYFGPFDPRLTYSHCRVGGKGNPDAVFKEVSRIIDEDQKRI